jgi:hypothetical protein
MAEKFKAGVRDFYLAQLPPEKEGEPVRRCVVAYLGRGKDTTKDIPQRFSFTPGVRLAGLCRVMCNTEAELVEKLKALRAEWEVPHVWQ